LENGDIDGAEKVLNSVKYPNLLYKPIRSAYYTVKGQLAMMKQDFDGAEKHMKKGLDLGTPMKEVKGASLLQMGMISLQKGNFKQGESYIRQAIREGFTDKEQEAAAYLQMCNIMMNKRDMQSVRAAKEFFRKAKALKPKQEEIVKQIKEIEKYISRIPG
jgi:tetratricopeptide (TPR) repeat protein